MPHIIIEHSENLAEVVDIQELVDVVHAAALADGLPSLAGLRTRAAGRRHYRVANGRPDLAFVAVTARIGAGRGRDEQHRFLVALVDAVERLLQPVQDRCPVALSVEIQQIDPDLRINVNHVAEALGERG